MKYLLILLFAIALSGCTTNTVIYTYDEGGIEHPMARVRQERDGLAMYEMVEEKITIKVDTRHKNWFERNIMPLFTYGSHQAVW
jgi:hypothetical protein